MLMRCLRCRLPKNFGVERMNSNIEEQANSVAKGILESDSPAGRFESVAAKASLAAMQHQVQQRAMLLGGMESSAIEKLRQQLSGLAKYSAGIKLPQMSAMADAQLMLAKNSSLLNGFTNKIPESFIKSMPKIDHHNLERSGINSALKAFEASKLGWAKDVAMMQGALSSNLLTDVKRLLGEPLHSFTKQVEAMNALDPTNSMRHVMEALRAPSLKMSESIAAISQSSPSHLSEVLAALNEPARKFAEQVSALQEVHKMSPAAHYAFVNHRIELEGIESFDAGEVEIRPSTEEEIALNSFASSGSCKDGIKAIELLTNVLAEVSKNLAQVKSNPLWLQIFVNAIGGLVASIIFSMVQPSLAKAWNEFNNVATPEMSKKEVRALILPSMRIDCYNTRKLVKKNGVEVRATDSANAKVISHLKCWDSVEVQRERKGWSLVSWTDSTGNINIQGWVFTRYLSKPNQL